MSTQGYQWNVRRRSGKDGPEKRCRTCEDWWPNTVEFFHRDPQRHDGLRNECRACRQANRKDHRVWVPRRDRRAA